jgi:hypothetical protein
MELTESRRDSSPLWNRGQGGDTVPASRAPVPMGEAWSGLRSRHRIDDIYPQCLAAKR